MGRLNAKEQLTLTERCIPARRGMLVSFVLQRGACVDVYYIHVA